VTNFICSVCIDQKGLCKNWDGHGDSKRGCLTESVSKCEHPNPVECEFYVVPKISKYFQEESK